MMKEVKNTLCTGSSAAALASVVVLVGVAHRAAFGYFALRHRRPYGGFYVGFVVQCV